MKNTRNLAIGILQESYYVMQMLYQNRLCFEEFSSHEALLASDCPVIICSSITREVAHTFQDKFFITSHIASKEAVCQKGFYFEGNGLFGERCFLADESCYALPTQEIEGETYGIIYDKNNIAIGGSGMTIKDNVISLPWNLDRLQFPEKPQKRPFYEEAVDKFFVEIGPNMEYGALRRLMLAIIRVAFEKRKLPLVIGGGIAEQGTKGFFSVRIDADGFTKESTKKVLEIATKYNYNFTWFLDMEAWKRGKNAIRMLAENGQDIQLHCYHHMTYEDRKTNMINLHKAMNLLYPMGIVPRGIVAPFGFYFKGFGKAIERMEFTYSSEFAFNTDDRPCYPLGSTVLQLPIHCGSVGTWMKYGFTQEEVFRCFEDNVEKGCSDSGIGVIYDHPVGRMEVYAEQFNTLIEALQKKGYSYMNYTEYAQRWQALVKTTTAVLLENGTVQTPKRAGESTIIQTPEQLQEQITAMREQKEILFRYPEEEIRRQAYDVPIIQMKEAKQTPRQYYFYIVRRIISMLLRDILKVRK